MSTTGTAARVDPVTASVIRHGLDAAVDQMLVTLRRTASSPIIYDMLDGAGAFYDRQFRMLSQIQCLPLPKGSRIEMRSGGGAGWGSPADRLAEDVYADLRAGLLSEAAARETYPHAFTD